MRKNNNKGSSMILVIVLFAVLFTIGGAVLMVINTNYKVRVKEGRRLQNLYESEAGLDVAYNIIAKNFESGVKSGRESVNNIKEEELEGLSNKEKGEKFDEVFKYGFKKVVNEEELKESIEGNKYIQDYNATQETEKYKVVKFNIDEDKEQPKLACDQIEIKSEGKKEKYEVTVVSEFQMDDSKSSTGKHLRKIQVVYEIAIPNYEDTIIGNNSETKYPDELNGKVIAIDGNMDILDSSSLAMNIEGDVFVKGVKKNDANYDRRVYEKYNGGITLGNNGSIFINVKGDILTPNTFNVANKTGNTHTYVDGNIYAGNIYVGSRDGEYATKNKIEVKGNTDKNNGQIVVDNDLAMKAKDSQIYIDRFYGINDINNATYDIDENGNARTTTRTSSSVIVNGNKNSSITINKEAYIMGTAYINAQNSNGESYKTSESVAVKGNYIAYTKPLAEFSQADFDMYGPLMLVDGLSAEEKEEYFKLFVENYAKKGEVSDGGVALPLNNTYSAGSIVYKRDNNLVVEKSNYNERTNSKILKKQEEYAKKVYSMDAPDEGANLSDIYDALGKQQKTVASKVNFDKINKEVIINKNDEVLVLNKDPNKTVVLTDNSSYISNANEIVVKVDTNKPINGLILTNGNIKVATWLINFKGAIVATGDLNVESSNGGACSINLSYSEDAIKKIISKYSSDLKGLFSTSTLFKSEDVIGTEAMSQYQYDIKQYVTSKHWKILR